LSPLAAAKWWVLRTFRACRHLASAEHGPAGPSTTVSMSLRLVVRAPVLSARCLSIAKSPNSAF